MEPTRGQKWAFRIEKWESALASSGPNWPPYIAKLLSRGHSVPPSCCSKTIIANQHLKWQLRGKVRPLDYHVRPPNGHFRPGDSPLTPFRRLLLSLKRAFVPSRRLLGLSKRLLGPSKWPHWVSECLIRVSGWSFGACK